MRRREFIAIVGGAAVAWPFMANAQQAGRIYRIGMLETISPALNAANFDAFRQSLRQLGLHRRAEPRHRVSLGRRPQRAVSGLAASWLRLRVDVIVTRGTPAALAAKEATATIPVVMAAIGEPLGVGVVDSLAHPGGNVTGFSAFVTELAGKRVELAKEMFPGLARVGVAQQHEQPGHPAAMGRDEEAPPGCSGSTPSSSTCGLQDVIAAPSKPPSSSVSTCSSWGSTPLPRRADSIIVELPRPSIAARGLRVPRVRRRRRADDLRRQLPATLFPYRRPSGQDPQGRASRATCRCSSP